MLTCFEPLLTVLTLKIDPLEFAFNTMYFYFQICYKGEWFDRSHSSCLMMSAIPLVTIKLFGCIFDSVTICFIGFGTMSNQNNSENDLTDRQIAMLKGPSLSLTFSAIYTFICGACSYVIFGMSLQYEMLFVIMLSSGFFYFNLTPILALYLMSRAEKSEERMTRVELKDRRLIRELQWAEEKIKNLNLQEEVKRLLAIEEDIFEV